MNVFVGDGNNTIMISSESFGKNRNSICTFYSLANGAGETSTETYWKNITEDMSNNVIINYCLATVENPIYFGSDIINYSEKIDYDSSKYWF